MIQLGSGPMFAMLDPLDHQPLGCVILVTWGSLIQSGWGGVWGAMCIAGTPDGIKI